MGCDIHMHVEYKKHDVWHSGDYYVKKSDCEYAFVDLYPGRNYDLFAMLANVRNRDYLEYISTPKGLPEDVTYAVMEDYRVWDGDAHSTSYLTLKELIDFYKDHKDNEAYLCLEYVIDKLKDRANDLYVIHDFMWRRDDGRGYELSDNIRIVFWFDN